MDADDPWPDIASEVYQIIAEHMVDLKLTEEQIWELGDAVVEHVRDSLKVLMKVIFG